MADPVVQTLPYDASKYDGSTPEKSFNYAAPEALAVRQKAAAFSTLLTTIRATLAMEDESASKGQHLLAILLAKKFDLLTNLPPFPLEGEHADVTAQNLGIGMAFWVEMEKWLNSPQTVTVETAGGPVQQTDVPLTVFRRLMPAGGVK